MKKFVKVSLITAGILFALGCILGAASSIAGGRIIFRNIREEKNLSSLQTTAEAEIPAAEIKNIQLELGAGTFIIEEKETADDTIGIAISGNGDCTHSVKGDTLYVRGFQGLKWIHGTDNSSLVKIRVPRGSSFDGIKIETGAGVVEISDIKADKLETELGASELYLKDIEVSQLSIEVGMGQVEASQVICEDADFEVGMGECDYEGTITGNLTVECGMGNVELSLTGSETDHNYEIDCAAGNVKIGSFSLVSLASERVINNNAASKFDIECSMGEVTITFQN
jgi:hypothetical protein